ESFASNRDKQTQWVAFTRRLQASEAPASLSEAIRVIAAFLQPVAQALSEGHPFDCRWLPDRGCWEGDRAPNQDRT
ncbi:MAG: hypothetical protein JW850_13435, partial [Thermoflexales bacterium]|nr:hypothetical protein [Thermoflexales bacterium]